MPFGTAHEPSAALFLRFNPPLKVGPVDIQGAADADDREFAAQAGSAYGGVGDALSSGRAL